MKPIPALTEKELGRFWAKVERGASDECWPWTGSSMSSDGRGCFHVRGVRIMAPRACWAIANQADPGDKMVCHACDNPSCVNPAHLWLGTCRDNVMDAVAKGRWPAAIRGTHCRRGHPMSGDNLWERGNRRVCRECGSLLYQRKKAIAHALGTTTERFKIPDEYKLRDGRVPKKAAPANLETTKIEKE